jgi:hypothetical protein
VTHPPEAKLTFCLSQFPLTCTLRQGSV